ncbi:M24 family metallopeptidase [Methylobacterium aquaticum]|uniref:M24 family metallopeptidase n=1 Tax=Methylobacterium aquaticum TaxID=270351 RepID=UPI003D168AC0
MVDPHQTVPQEALNARLASLQDWMSRQGLASLVVFGRGHALGTATRSHGSLRFLADWDGDNADSALVVRSDDRPSLVVSNVFAAMRARESHRFAEVCFGQGEAFARHVLELAGGADGPIALAGRDEMPLLVWERLAAAGADAWLSVEHELARRRTIKDQTAIAYYREAARICDALFARVGAALRTGRPVYAVQAELEALARGMGCEFCQTWLTVAPVPDRCRYLVSENGRIPTEGDQFLLGIMLLLHGHWGHAIRTGALGTPTPAAERAFAEVQDMHAAMLERLRPGRDLREVGAAGRAPGGRDVFQFRSGHALGHSYEDPIGTAEFPQPYDPGPQVPMRVIEPGMLFELHPNLFLRDAGAAAIGDMVLVTERGPELLTTFPRAIARC